MILFDSRSTILLSLMKKETKELSPPTVIREYGIR